MSFEDEFRTTLQAQAGDLDLRGRGATEVMHLARRRQHRARRAGALAAVGVLGVGAVGVFAARGDDDGVAIVSADQPGLADVGPLELSWQTAPGGITGGMYDGPRFVEDGGVTYALSTAPGSRYPTDGSSMTPALYRLADDGTWVAASTDGTVPLVDLAADGSTLYAIGTAPGTSAIGYDSVLSSSVDGGTTWATASTSLVVPPSTAIAWDAGSTLAIERVPGATVAVASSRFSPPDSLIDQVGIAAGADPADDLGYDITDAGIDVVRWRTGDVGREPPPSSGTTAPPTTVDPANAVVPSSPGATVAPEPTSLGADEADPREVKGESTSEVLATISWADVGVSGRSDLTTTQVLVLQGGSWVPVDAPALADVSVTRLDAAGQDLLLEGWTDGGRTRQTFTSTDGIRWRPVAVGEDSRISGLGNVWVDAPWNGGGSPVVRSSSDQGASWSTIDLGTVDGRLAGASTTSADSGPLGLAVVLTQYGDSAEEAVSYLVTTRDLQNWTVTPLADITGPTSAAAAVHVGTDRIIVTATEGYTGDDAALPASVTAIGTPVR